MAATLGFTACSESFLEREDLYRQSDASYYQNPSQIQSTLTGAYSVLPVGPGGNQPTLMGVIRSPYFLGGADGAGLADIGAQSNDKFEFFLEDTYLDLWREYYKGIQRVNTILKRFDQAEYGTNVAQRDMDLGETYFLRGYFYFKLSQFYGEVPLVLDPEPLNLPKAPADEMFAQIASDLNQAITLLDGNGRVPLDKLGHASEWAAKSLMARVWLFYTGTYNKTELPLAEGGSISKAQVSEWIVDVVDNSGHKLLDDFEQLWPYSSPLFANETYPYRQNGTFGPWVGAANATGTEYNPENIEGVFVIPYNSLGDHAASGSNPYNLARSNQMCLYMGVRDNNATPFGSGWGFGPVHPELWEQFEDGDSRKLGTLINIWNDESKAVEGDIADIETWDPTSSSGLDNTGVLLKKYMPLRTSSNNADAMWIKILGEIFNDNQQFSALRDEYLIRFADVLLMAAELTENADYLNQVRERAGLAPVAYSLDAVKQERCVELAGEGIYYWDLMRWGDLKATFDAMPVATVWNQGTEMQYKIDFREDRKFNAIPESQVSLSAGTLEQNEGWR